MESMGISCIKKKKKKKKNKFLEAYPILKIVQSLEAAPSKQSSIPLTQAVDLFTRQEHI